MSVLSGYLQQFRDMLVQVPLETASQLSQNSADAADALNNQTDQVIDSLNVPDSLKADLKRQLDNNQIDTFLLDQVWSLFVNLGVNIRTGAAPLDIITEVREQSLRSEAPFLPSDLGSIAGAAFWRAADLTQVPDEARKLGLTDQGWADTIDAAKTLANSDQIILGRDLGEVREDGWRQELRRTGLTSGFHQDLVDLAARQRPSIADIFTLWHRQEIPNEEKDRRLKGEQIVEGEAGRWEELSRPILQVGDLTELMRRGRLDDRVDTTTEENRREYDPETGANQQGTYAGQLSSLGYDQASRDALEDIWQRIPDLRDLWDQQRKGLLTRDQLIERLRTLGFVGDEAVRQADIRLFDPTPADLVQFGVKDVFQSDIAARFGVYDENPREGAIGAEEAADQFPNFLQASGLRPEAWDVQWAAHWQLPAFGQIIEAIHRGFIPASDLNTWLRALDFSPGTREIMGNLFFEQIPRRTVGQLLRFGIISEEDAQNRMEALGFRPVDARLQLEREQFIGGQGPRELTKSDILSSFEDGLIDRGQALLMLKDIGFTTQATATLLNQAEQNIAADQGTITLPRDREAEEDAVSGIKSTILRGLENGTFSRGEALQQLSELGFSNEAAEALVEERLLQRELDDRDFTAGELGEMFRERVIDEANLRGRLQSAGFRRQETDRLLQRWKLERERKEKIDAKRDEKPSRTTLEDWLEKGIISVSGFANRMAELGWQDDDIALFIQEKLIDTQSSGRIAQAIQGA